jgi:hypothetical protein
MRSTSTTVPRDPETATSGRLRAEVGRNRDETMKKIVRAVGPLVNNLRRYSAPSVALYDAVRAPLVGWF